MMMEVSSRFRSMLVGSNVNGHVNMSVVCGGTDPSDASGRVSRLMSVPWPCASKRMRAHCRRVRMLVHHVAQLWPLSVRLF
jgi:hypothetical protein